MSAVETEASLNQVLRRKDHALRKLIQKIVHDSNNYYSVFKGYISLLDISSLDKDVLGRYLPPMKDALQSGIRLNTRLTAYFHVVSPMRIELDLSALANEVCARQAAEHNFTVTVTTEGDCPPILVEEPSVRSLLANLCLLAEETDTVDAVLLLDSQWLDAAQLAGRVLASTPGVYLLLQLTSKTTMCEQEDRNVAFFLQLSQQVEDLRLNRDVEGGRRLVGDEEFGIAGEGHRDHHALPHAAG